MKMQKCIYCQEEKGASSFNGREHVMPEEFGKFEPVNFVLRCVCDSCNGYFGRELDIVLGRGTYESLLRAQFDLKSIKDTVQDFMTKWLVMRVGEEGEFKGMYARPIEIDGALHYGPIPQLRFALATGSGWKYVREEEFYRDGLSPEVDHRKATQIIASSDADFDRFDRLLRRKGVTIGKKTELKLAAAKSREVLFLGEYIADRIIQRAVSKIAFNFLALVFTEEIVRGNAFDEMRQFVLRGVPPSFKFFSVYQKGLLRTESDFENASRHYLRMRYLPASRDLVIEVTLFHVVAYTIIVAKNYSGILPPGDFEYCFDLKRRKILSLRGSPRPVTFA